ncbi:hypothetical protein BEWA_013600 [Theileria equi strain WA]|uniref:Uncharacterized protein n=1 Tax=Theileria equi strain WA TaxID=1537102 RepID=L1LBV1_THEEQ|nr:hypothetical protein BEWA_013600 [Theileria equi strain WA]EKX72801.1 hypothetical protein BEWA_013600 [Theileria equi strain WA]|eukprot:XP_004832253.1 hypothetical protein BEWA_013600 [Theileria equi strain WA]
MSTKRHRGLTIEEYTPKSGFNVTSVVEADKELWKASGEEKGGDFSHIDIKINDGKSTKTKQFEKNVNDEWVPK